jgi:hypothetical protein
MDTSILSNTLELSKADIAIIEGLRLGIIQVDVENGIVYGSAGHAMKGSANHDGYIRVRINYPSWKNGSNVFVHRIVAFSVWGYRLFELEVNHINENKADNRIINLELVKHEQNMAHSMNGLKNHMTKLTEDQVREIRQRYKFRGGKNSGKALAEEFNVDKQLISNIVHYKIWKHVIDPELFF